MTEETFDAFEEQFEDVDTSAAFTPEMMARRLVWDMIPHGRALETIKELGLPSVSEDVENAEHGEAHMRQILARTLLPLTMPMAHQIASIQVAEIKRRADPQIEERIALAAWTQVIFTAVEAVIGELLVLNYLHLPHSVFEDDSEEEGEQ